MLFTINKEPIRIEIKDMNVMYFDRKWENGIQFIPKDSLLVKWLLLNQRQHPFGQQIISWINEANSGDNLKEYQACKTDEDIAHLVRRDALSKGLVEV